MKVTVYCGAHAGKNERYRSAAIKVGEWIAHNHHTLVYGGSAAGLMGTVADTVLEAGGKAIGVMPKFLTVREPVHPTLTELLYVEDMSERKKKMAALGDAFIALPGGAGTLEEITEVISWSRIGRNNSPCILWNENEYYAPLQAMYDRMVAEGFLSAADRSKILFSNDFQEIERFIMDYEPPAFLSDV